MISQEEIEMLEKLLKLEQLESSIKNCDENLNPNYIALFKAISEQRYDDTGKLIAGYRGFALEGSSRSGKTWSGVDVIIWLCLFVEKNCTINIYRETYNEFKTTLYDDFKRRLQDFELPNPFLVNQEIKQFKIGNNKIYFLGDGKHGGSCDYAFFNEIMMQKNSVFDQVEMRCRKFWWADYNPSFTDHWFFDKVLKRTDVGFLRTNLNDNPYISFQEKNKIMSYEPWASGSYQVENSGEIFYKGKPISDLNQPPKHIENVEQGTADEYMWKVYGLGIRGSMKGLIFNHISYIDEFPEGMHYIYGNDFGFTNDPNALVRYAEDECNIYFEVLNYTPVENPESLSSIFESHGIKKNSSEFSKDGDIIICDSSDKYTGENKGTVEMVKSLRKFGYNAMKVSKTKSVMFWINSMKNKKIHCVKGNTDLWKLALKEQQNYRFREVQGIQINQPEDSHNHIYDSVRYAHISYNSNNSKIYTTDSVTLQSINY